MFLEKKKKKDLMGLALWPKKERRKISGLDAKYKSSREIPTKPPGP